MRGNDVNTSYDTETLAEDYLMLLEDLADCRILFYSI